MSYRVIFQALENLLGKGKEGGGLKPEEVLFPCPFCQHRKPKLAISLNSGKYHCWVCTARGNSYLELIKNKFGQEAYDSMYKLNEFYGLLKVDETHNKYVVNDTELQVSESLKLPDNFIEFNSKRAKGDIFCGAYKNYLLNRGITEKDIIELKLGYDSEDKRVIFPSYDLFNRLNYHTGRAIYDSVLPKYKHAHITAHGIVFNEYLLDFDDKDIFLVEGTFDYVKVDYVDKNIICTLGSQINYQSYLFKTIMMFNNIYICYDKDAVKKMISIAKEIIKYGKKVFILDWNQEALKGLKDLGELPCKISVDKLVFQEYNMESHIKIIGEML